MTAKAKICGVSTPEAVRAVVDGGAAFLGFMFFPRSPRNIAPDAAARLAPPARAKGVKIVAVTVDRVGHFLSIRRTQRPKPPSPRCRHKRSSCTGGRRRPAPPR